MRLNALYRRGYSSTLLLLGLLVSLVYFMVGGNQTLSLRGVRPTVAADALEDRVTPRTLDGPLMPWQLHSDVNLVSSVPDPSVTSNYTDCMPLPESPKLGVIICPHSMETDYTITRVLKTNKLWEPELIYAMNDVLKQDESLMLFDVGCNIGEYTLWAVALGRTVVCVEMLMDNVQRVQMALKLSGLSNQVTIVNNALYSDHRSLETTFIRKSLGTSRLNVSKPFGLDRVDQSRKVVVKTICIDDLTPLMRAKNVYLKMDIENTEQHALMCAHKFFHEVNVRVVQMEWHRRVPEESVPILNFMAAHGYVASLKGKEYSPVELSKIGRNIDVFFLKKSLFKIKD